MSCLHAGQTQQLAPLCRWDFRGRMGPGGRSLRDHVQGCHMGDEQPRTGSSCALGFSPKARSPLTSLSVLLSPICYLTAASAAVRPAKICSRERLKQLLETSPTHFLAQSLCSGGGPRILSSPCMSDGALAVTAAMRSGQHGLHIIFRSGPVAGQQVLSPFLGAQLTTSRICGWFSTLRSAETWLLLQSDCCVPELVCYSNTSWCSF